MISETFHNVTHPEPLIGRGPCLLSTYRRHVLNDVREVIEIASQNPFGRRSDAHRLESSRRGESFAGTEDFSEAVTLASTGWHEGLERAAAISAALVDRITGARIERPKLHLQPAGFRPCVPVAIAGAPDNMQALRKVESFGAGKVIDLVFNGGATAGVSAETMILRGAVCLALIDLLEGAGYRVEVTRINCGHDGEIASYFAFPLKNADQQPDADTLSFWLAHPAAHRRFTFGLREVCDYETFGKTGGDYSSSEPFPEDKGDLYLSAANMAQITSNKNAIPFLRAQLAAVGVEIEN